MKSEFFAGVFLALLLSGCTTVRHDGINGDSVAVYNDSNNVYATYSETPLATNFPASMQRKLQAAEHWKRVANFSANELSKSLGNNGNCDGSLRCKTLYIQRICSTKGCTSMPCDTVFGKIFYEGFVSALVNLGFKVSTVPVPESLTIEVDINAISFSGNRSQYRYAGKKVEISDGVWALTDVTTVYDDGGDVIKPKVEGALNWFRSEFATGKTPSTELVLTVSAATPDQVYVGRNTEVYYIQDSDISFYRCNTPLPTQPTQAIKSCSTCAVRTFDEKTWLIGVEGDCSNGKCKNRP